MSKIGLPIGSCKCSKVSEKSLKGQEIMKLILSGNPDIGTSALDSGDYQMRP